MVQASLGKEDDSMIKTPWYLKGTPIPANTGTITGWLQHCDHGNYARGLVAEIPATGSWAIGYPSRIMLIR